MRLFRIRVVSSLHKHYMTKPERQRIVLYNPWAAYYDMPLALLAIAGGLDQEQYQPVIIDGRMSEDALAQVLSTGAQSLCLGVTVITGKPIRDALRVSRAWKAKYPDKPVIWGGWHPSLFPTEVLTDEAAVDITVQGQGEITFACVVDAIANGADLTGVQGICYRDREGNIHRNPPRQLVAMDALPDVNYDLIDVEAYFAKKGRRTFDIISSTGCFFRCAFCSDPTVFERKFTAISGDRLAQMLATYQEKYGFTDVNFQDETFFTYPKRIQAFAQGILERGLKFSWAATMRADQGQRMDHTLWESCKRSGLRRLLIGVESGSQEMMDWLKKDIKIEQVLACAEKSRDLGIAVHFPFIVGFPGETNKSLKATAEMARRLASMSPLFEAQIFFFKPYPGSAITREVVASGYKLPQSTEAWADFDFHQSQGPWIKPRDAEYFSALRFYLRLGYGRHRWYARPVHAVARMRCKTGFFGLPIEKRLYEAFLQKEPLT